MGLVSELNTSPAVLLSSTRFFSILLSSCFPLLLNLKIPTHIIIAQNSLKVMSHSLEVQETKEPDK